MPCRLSLVWVVVVGVVVASAEQRCNTNADCSMLGKCTESGCVCDPGWKGPACGQVALEPALLSAAMVWPRAPVQAAVNVSAWGFTVVVEDGRYHAVVTAACGLNGVLGRGGGSSLLVHVSSPSLSGPYTLEGLVSPATTFNPHLITVDGGYALYFRVNALDREEQCTGNGSDPMPNLPPYIHRDQLQPGPPSAGTNIYVAWSSRMSGPWQVERLSLSPSSSLHKSNPSVVRLDDGSYFMAYRNNPKGGEDVAFATGKSFKGPFQGPVANLSCHGCEDPFAWQQPASTSSPLSVHVLFHNGPHGYHAFAPRPEGPWTIGQAYPFELKANTTTAPGSITYQRRERPEMVFANGHPAALITGVYTEQGACYSMLQNISQSNKNVAR
eukprot:m.193212 g.193212  ORF g.193212 m.193212 type:complete len:384 (+) comp18288_c0_seq2:216-1367(+)